MKKKGYVVLVGLIVFVAVVVSAGKAIHRSSYPDMPVSMILDYYSNVGTNHNTGYSDTVGRPYGFTETGKEWEDMYIMYIRDYLVAEFNDLGGGVTIGGGVTNSGYYNTSWKIVSFWPSYLLPNGFSRVNVTFQVFSCKPGMHYNEVIDSMQVHGLRPANLREFLHFFDYYLSKEWEFRSKWSYNELIVLGSMFQDPGYPEGKFYAVFWPPHEDGKWDYALSCTYRYYTSYGDSVSYLAVRP